MKSTRLGSVLVLAASGALALSACGTDNNTPAAGSGAGPSAAGSTTGAGSGSSGAATAAATSGAAPSGASGGSCGTGDLKGAGSTFQKNIELEWIAQYGKSCSTTKVDYQGTGSGAGIQSFTNNLVDFAGSDSLMKPDEQAAADKRCGTGKAEHIPVTAGAIVLVYNLSGVDKLKLSPATVAGIFTGKITKWNAAEVAADNAGATLPDLAIQAVHRSDSSGTTDNLSKYLDNQAKGVWTLGTGKELMWPTSIQAAKGSDGVSNAVKGANGAISYAEQSFAIANSLTTASLKNASGAYVAPSGDAVKSALATAKVDDTAGDLRVKIDFATTAADAYPADAVSYAIVCTKGNKQAGALKGYLTYATGDGQSLANDLGFAALPGELNTKVKTLVASIG